MVLAYLRAYTSHASYAVTAPAFDPAMHRAVHVTFLCYICFASTTVLNPSVMCVFWTLGAHPPGDHRDGGLRCINTLISTYLVLKCQLARLCSGSVMWSMLILYRLKFIAAPHVMN